MSQDASRHHRLQRLRRARRPAGRLERPDRPGLARPPAALAGPAARRSPRQDGGVGQLDLRRLRLLRELRDRETVTAVAAALHMTSSAVSQQLAQLGREVGAPLLEPHGRRVRLSRPPSFCCGTRTCSSSSWSRHRPRSRRTWRAPPPPCGWTVFATAISKLAVPAMRRLAATEPTLTWELHEANTEEALDRLLRGETDLVIGLDGDVRVDDPRFGRRPLLIDPMDVALPAGSTRWWDKPIQLADLAADPWILPPGGLCRDIALRECATAGFTPRAAQPRRTTTRCSPWSGRASGWRWCPGCARPIRDRTWWCGAAGRAAAPPGGAVHPAGRGPGAVHARGGGRAGADGGNVQYGLTVPGWNTAWTRVPYRPRIWS